MTRQEHEEHAANGVVCVICNFLCNPVKVGDLVPCPLCKGAGYAISGGGCAYMCPQCKGTRVQEVTA